MSSNVKWYGVIDENSKIVAYTDNIGHAKKYIKSVDSSNKLYYVKLKKGCKINENLILIKYKNKYIQNAYVKYLRFSSEYDLEDEAEQVKDFLNTFLSTFKISKKYKKKIIDVIDIIDDVVKNESDYVPTIRELEEIRSTYERYVYNINED